MLQMSKAASKTVIAIPGGWGYLNERNPGVLPAYAVG